VKTTTIDRFTPFDDLPEYLTPDEVRVFLNLTRNQTYDWLRSMPCIRCGRLIRVRKAALRPEERP
jgi:hypothetical protein